ncbi:MAG: hypothetical protein PQJ59_03935 [Spirochaetales bacterium]|nr:hypothetical protein [Spirochaetales bacterium]
MKKIYPLLGAVLFAVLPLAADDFSFDDLMSGDVSTDSGSGDDFDFGSDFGFGDTGSSASALSISGDAELSLREIAGDDNWDDLLEGSEWDWSPSLTLDLLYTTDKADFTANLNVNEDDLSDDLFNELAITWYEDKFTLAAGYQEVVWGKGDKVHVVDMLNPMDYTDFLNADYLDRKIAQPMLKVNIPHSRNGQLELVYVPFFEGDSYAYEGTWATSDAVALMSTLETAVKNSAYAEYNAASAYGDEYATAAMISYLSGHDEADELLPDTDSLKYGQAAIRGTASLGAVDLGAMYWFGYNRQPTVYYTGSDLEYYYGTYGYDDFDIDYDQLQVFGLEAGAVAAGFNLRAEAAYYMTEDYDGSDEDIINPSFEYVIGFDRNLPVSNLNLNLQANGSYTLFYDEIESAYDVEYGDDETFTLIICKLSDTWNHEKVKPEVTMIYCAEDQSGQISPAVAMDVDGNLSFEAKVTMFWGDDDSFFGYFDDNDFLELNAMFSF